MVNQDRNERYERVARYLDGGGGSLSPEEARLAEAIRGEEAWLADRMDSKMPDAVLLRVGARLNEASSPAPAARPRLWPRVLRAAGAVAAAAAVVLVFVLPADPPNPPPSPIPHTGAPAVLTYAPTAEEEGFEIAADLLDEQMVTMMAEMRLDNASALQLKIDAMDERIKTFWLDPMSAELGEEVSL